MAAVEAVAEAIAGAEGIIKPLVDKALAQHAKDLSTARKAELQSLLLLPSGDARADKLAAYYDSLCRDAGTPVLGLGDNIAVPATFLLAFGGFGCDLILENTLANQLIQKLAE